MIVAAVLLGSVFSTLFAGVLADWMGRKPLMILSGLTFVVSIPVIALSHGYGPLFFGRLLQGISGGLIGVVVPLYLAECLSASNRGKGTAIFQWMLTLGIVAAALVGIYYSYRVEAVAKAADAAALFAFKDQAWRRIFWVSLPPGALFVLGSLFVTESPRWLFRRGSSAARPRCAASLAEHASRPRSRLKRWRRLRMRHSASAGQEDSGFAAAAQVRDSVSAGLRDSGLQHGDRRQLDHRLQHQHSVAERALRPACALGLRDLHGGEFSDDHGGHDAGGSQGAQISVHPGHQRHHCRADRRGDSVSAHGEGQRGLARDRFSKWLDRTSSSRCTSIRPRRAGCWPQRATRAAKSQSDRASLAIIYSYGDFTAATSFVRSDDRGGAAD